MSVEGRDAVLIGRILSEIEDIECFAARQTQAAFARSRVTQKAIAMSLINIGELSKGLSPAFIAATPQIPWRDIRGLRNLAAHHYAGLDMADIYLTVKQDVPRLRDALVAQLV